MHPDVNCVIKHFYYYTENNLNLLFKFILIHFVLQFIVIRYLYQVPNFWHYCTLKHFTVCVYLGGHEPEWGTQSASAWKGLEHETWDGGPVHLSHRQICKWEYKPKCCITMNWSVLYNCSGWVEVSWHSTRFSRMSLTWSSPLLLAFSSFLAHSHFCHCLALHSSCLTPTSLIAILICFLHWFPSCVTIYWI